VVTSAFGASDEWHQSFVPGRSAEVADWVADTAGAACAAVLYVRWTWYRRQLERVLPWPTRYGGTSARAES
jgi:VanZ family protein